MIIMDIERIDLQTSKLERYNPKTNKIEIDYVYDAEHLATDWEISDSLDFKNILVSSYENYNYKKTIIFSDNLDPSIRYYGRARALLTTGYTQWGNVHIFTMRNDSDLKPQDVFPTRVGTPILKTYRMNLDNLIDDIVSSNSSKPIINNNPWNPSGTIGDTPEFANPGEVVELLESIDPNNHDLALFEIWADGFEVIGNAKLLATSWWIEDTNGDVIWKSLDDIFNLRKVQVKNILLRKDRVYRIRAMFHTTSKDSSQIGTYTITTKSSTYGILSSYLDLVNPSLDTEITIEFEPGINTVHWEVISFEYGILTPIWNSVSTSISSFIPKNTLKYNTNYILRIKTNLSKSWNYYPFITSIDPGINMDATMTPVIAYPTSFTLTSKDTANIYVSANKDASFAYEIDKEGIIEFNPINMLIKAISPGEATLYLRYKQEGYAERIIRVYINVVNVESEGNSTGGYIKVLPNEYEMKNDTDASFNVSTNCNRWIVDYDTDKASLEYISAKVFKYRPKVIGQHKLIAIGYDTQSNMVASEPINIKVIVNDKPVGPVIPEDKEYYFRVDVTELELTPGTNGTINIITNCDYWELIQNNSPDVVSTKVQGNVLVVTPLKIGEGYLVLGGSDGIRDDIGLVSIPYVVNYRKGITVFEFDKKEYTVNVNNELTIKYDTNCDSLDEITTTINGNNITLVRQTLTEMVINPEEGSDDQNVVIDVEAKKTTTQTDVYSKTEDSCLVKIPKVLIPIEDMIRIPDSAKKYTDGLYSVDAFQPKNPLKIAIHINKNITTTTGMIVTGVPYSNDTGTIKGLELGPELVEEDGSVKFRLLYILINTNSDSSQPYGPGTTNEYIINVSIPFDGVYYKRSFTTIPIPITELSIDGNEDIYFANIGDTKELIIRTNANDISYSLKDIDVVTIVKEKEDDIYTLRMTCIDVNKSTELTISATNETGFTKTIKVSLYIGQLYGDIGVASSMADWDIETWMERVQQSDSEEDGDIDISNYYLDNDPKHIYPPLSGLNWNEDEWNTWATEQYNRWYNATTELAELAKTTIVKRPIVGTTLKTPTVYQVVGELPTIVEINGECKFKQNNDTTYKFLLYIRTGPNPNINITLVNNEYSINTTEYYTISHSIPVLVTDLDNEPGLNKDELVDPAIPSVYKVEFTISIKDPNSNIENSAYNINITADFSNKVLGTTVEYKGTSVLTMDIVKETLTYRLIGFKDMRNWDEDYWSLFKPGFPKLSTIKPDDSINIIPFPLLASVINDDLTYNQDTNRLIPPLNSLNWSDNQWSNWVTEQVDKYQNKLLAIEASGQEIKIQKYGNKIESGNYLLHFGGKYGLLSRYKSIHQNQNYTVNSVTNGDHMIATSIKLTSLQISQLPVNDEIVLGRLALFGGNTSKDRFYPVMAESKGNGIYYVILAPYTNYEMPESDNKCIIDTSDRPAWDFNTANENCPMTWDWFINYKTPDDYPDDSEAKLLLEAVSLDDSVENQFEVAVVLSDGSITPIDTESVSAEQILSLVPEAYKYNGMVDVFKYTYDFNINDFGEVLPDDYVEATESEYRLDNESLPTALLKDDGNMRDLSVYPIRPEEVLLVLDYGSYEVENPLGWLCVANVFNTSNITKLIAKDGNRNISVGITTANMISRIELDNGNSTINNSIKFEVTINKNDQLVDTYENSYDLDLTSTDTGLRRVRLSIGTSIEDVPNPTDNEVDTYTEDEINSMIY